MGDVKPMAQKRTTVAVPSELYESIEPIIKSVTGVKPVVADFVADAIREKLEAYRVKQAEMLGAEPGPKAAAR